MDDIDLSVVAAVLLQFGFDLCRIAHQKKFGDVRVFSQRHHGASYQIRRAKIAAHSIQGDPHCERILRTLVAQCKTKNLNVGTALVPRFQEFSRGAEALPHYLPSMVRTWRPL